MAVTLDFAHELASPTVANPTVSTHAHAVAANALLHVEVANYTSTAGAITSMVASDGTHTYTLTIDPTVNNSDPDSINVFLTTGYAICAGGLAAGWTLTVTFAGTTAAVEQGGISFNGVDSSTPRRASAVAATSSLNWATGSITDVIGDAVVSFNARTGGAGTNTPTSPALDANQSGGFQARQYDIEAVGGSISRAGTWSAGSAVGNVYIAAYRAAAASPPVNTVLPAVTGTAEQTFTLTTTNGTWTGDVSSGYAYQWQRDGFGDLTFANIPGATSSTYVQTITDVDCNVRCVVTATGTGGSTAANSNVVGPVYACQICTVNPVISGGVTVGNLLTTTNGTWVGGKAALVQTYQWRQDASSNIGGATAATYTLVAGDIGHTIDCLVTSTDALSATQTADSNALGPAVGLLAAVGFDETATIVAASCL